MPGPGGCGTGEAATGGGGGGCEPSANCQVQLELSAAAAGRIVPQPGRLPPVLEPLSVVLVAGPWTSGNCHSYCVPASGVGVR
jgi:hypothetical protein